MNTRRVVCVDVASSIGAILARSLVGVGICSALSGVSVHRLRRWLERGRITEYRLLGGVFVDLVEVLRLTYDDHKAAGDDSVSVVVLPDGVTLSRRE